MNTLWAASDLSDSFRWCSSLWQWTTTAAWYGPGWVTGGGSSAPCHQFQGVPLRVSRAARSPVSSRSAAFPLTVSYISYVPVGPS